MSIRVDKIQLEIEVRNRQRNDEIVKLNEELNKAGRNYRRLQNEVDRLNDLREQGKGLSAAETKELQQLTARLAQAKREYEQLDQKKTEYVKQNKLETMTIFELSKEYRQYRELIRHLDPNSDYYKKTQDYLDALKNRMSELNRRTAETKNTIRNFAEWFNRITFAITNTLAIKDRIVQKSGGNAWKCAGIFVSLQQRNTYKL